MIKLYTAPTPNGHKVSIMLEEVGLDYEVSLIDIGKGDQFEEEFLKISPNNKIPAIVDTEGYDGASLSVFESGAILIYLAEKTGQFLPSKGRARLEVLEWLMFQMGGIGPMLGQAHHFRRFAPEQIAYGIERYTKEAQRIYSVVDRRLSQREYLGGDDYSIADIASFPWLRAGIEMPDFQGVNPDAFPYYRRWYNAINSREGVQRGLLVPKIELPS